MSQNREAFAPLSRAAKATSGILPSILGNMRLQKAVDEQGEFREEPLKMIKGLETLTYEERLKELNMYCLAKRQWREVRLTTDTYANTKETAAFSTGV